MDAIKTQALKDILKDKSLLKEQCYIDGKWVSGDETIEVTNPAPSIHRTIPPTLLFRRSFQMTHAFGKIWHCTTTRSPVSMRTSGWC